jgi:WD repeat-containing protein mio
MMQFEASHSPEMLGSLFVEDALSNIPIFGKTKADVGAIISEALGSQIPAADLLVNSESIAVPLPDVLWKPSTTAEKLRALRKYAREALQVSHEETSVDKPTEETSDAEKALADMSLSQDGPPSCRVLHDNLLRALPEAKGLPREAQSVMDHAMLLRAKEKYLFDATTNASVVSDDHCLRYVWDWIAGRCFAPAR